MHDPTTDGDDTENQEPFVRAFSMAELPAGESRMEQVGDYDVAFFNVGGEIYALDDVCPHFGGSMHLGQILDDGKIVACPLHGWRFNLCDGKMNPGRRNLASFEVRIENGDVFVSREPRPAL